MYDDPCFHFFALNVMVCTSDVQEAPRQFPPVTRCAKRYGWKKRKGLLQLCTALCFQSTGTKQYWYHQWSRLFNMVDTLGRPTIFFIRLQQILASKILSAQTTPIQALIMLKLLLKIQLWQTGSSSIDLKEFIKAYYVGVLGVKDYWMLFKW